MQHQFEFPQVKHKSNRSLASGYHSHRLAPAVSQSFQGRFGHDDQSRRVPADVLNVARHSQLAGEEARAFNSMGASPLKVGASPSKTLSLHRPQLSTHSSASQSNLFARSSTTSLIQRKLD